MALVIACGTEPSDPDVALRDQVAALQAVIPSALAFTLIAHSQDMAAALTGAGATAVEPVPAALHGQTLTWNDTSGRYEASPLPGAPRDGVRFAMYRVLAPGTLKVLPLDHEADADVVADPAGGVTLLIASLDGDARLEYRAVVDAAGGRVTSGEMEHHGGGMSFVFRQPPTPGLRARWQLSGATAAGGITVDARFDFPFINETVDVDITVTAPAGVIRYSGRADVHGWDFEVRRDGVLRYHIGTDRQINVTYAAREGTLTAVELELLQYLVMLDRHLQGLAQALESSVSWPEN